MTAKTEPAGQSHAKTVLGTGIGNALEWYDWGVYAVFTPFFAGHFFDSADPTSAVLATFAVFAVGFFGRPVGGLLLGWIADRTGRQFAMCTAVGAASLGSMVIAVSPGYRSIGAAASIILVLARVLQGLAHGGELPAAQTYLAEMAPDRNRGLWSSLIYLSGAAGNLFGVLLGVVLTSVFSDDQMTSFGWRIPFLAGGVLGLYALYMRTRLIEPTVFANRVSGDTEPSTPSLWRQIVRHRRPVLQVIGLTTGFTVAFYAWAIAAPAYAISSLGIDATAALWAGVAADAVFIAALAPWGMLSDRIGRKPLALLGALGTAAVLFPVQLLIRDQAWQLGLGMSSALVFLAAFSSIAPAMYAELFPTRIRALGVGIPYSICVAVFGGTAPYLQTWLDETFGRSAFTGYTALALLVSAAVVATLPETRGRPLHD